MKITVITLGFLLLAGPAFSAANYECKTVPPEKSRLPKEVYSSGKFPSGAAIRQCAINSKDYDFYVRGAAVHDAVGVCRFEEYKLGDVSKNPLDKGTELHITYLLRPVDRCPSNMDLSYVPTNDISGGVFIAITKFVDGLKTAASVNYTPGASSSVAATQFLKKVGDQGAKWKIQEIRFASAEHSTIRAPSYEIFLGDMSDKKPQLFALTVDLQDGGIEVLQIELPVP